MDNVQMVKDLYEAFGRGDVGSVLASFDPNIEWSVAEGGPYQPDGKPWWGPVTIPTVLRTGSRLSINPFLSRPGTGWRGQF